MLSPCFRVWTRYVHLAKIVKTKSNRWRETPSASICPQSEQYGREYFKNDLNRQTWICSYTLSNKFIYVYFSDQPHSTVNTKSKAQPYTRCFEQPFKRFSFTLPSSWRSDSRCGITKMVKGVNCIDLLKKMNVTIDSVPIGNRLPTVIL